jgi:hypothetical protein
MQTFFDGAVCVRVERQCQTDPGWILGDAVLIQFFA